MKKNIKNRLTTRISKLLYKTKVMRWRLAGLSAAVLTAPMTVYASDAESAWNDTMDTIQPWVTRIGILLIVFGGIEFAISQSNEDAAQKTRAARFMIAGAIVVAISTQLFPMLAA